MSSPLSTELRPQKYEEQRPPEYFQPLHEWVRTHGPGWTYELVRLIAVSSIFLYRARAISTVNVPADGPAIFAPNHFSNLDHFFSGGLLRRKIHFMGKSQMFGHNPVLDYVFRDCGVFPVRRGQHDEEAFITANAILKRGGTVLVYAEGGRARTGGLREPKAGVGRLALESGVPVIPVAIHGSRGVRRWKRLRFPKVTVQYGEPITFPQISDPDRAQALEASKRIFDRVKLMYTALEEQGRASVIRSIREGAADRISGPPPQTQS